MKLDLDNATREELIQLNLQLIARLQTLEEQVRQLKAELDSLRGGGSQSNPPSFVKANRPLVVRKKSVRSERMASLASLISLRLVSSTRLSNARTANLIS